MPEVKKDFNRVIACLKDLKTNSAMVDKLAEYMKSAAHSTDKEFYQRDLDVQLKQKLGPLQKKWVAELRSGNYQQCKDVLHSTIKDPSTGEWLDMYCCLGVACGLVSDLAVREPFFRDDCRQYRYAYGEKEATEPAPEEVVNALRLRAEDGGTSYTLDYGITKILREDYGCEFAGRHCISLSNFNDNGATFEQIADIIELVPFLWFTEAA